jgi:squalene-associated FAD-dependent desaturase
MPQFPETSRVHIIGGGLAGLAAALDLVDAGHRVSLYEAGPACGGRCRSYFDRELGCRIDNGNHLLLSGNASAMRYLDRLGTRHTLGGPDRPIFPFMDLRDQTRWTIRPNMGRLPWWVLSARRGVPGARLADYATLLRLRTARADDTVAAVLPKNALYTRLIEPLAIAALNTPPDQGSARLFWAVIAESLAKGGRHCIPCFPKEGLSESFVDPAVTLLAQNGADMRTSHRISALTTEHGSVASLVGPDGPIAIPLGDSIVLAVPAPVAATLLPGTLAPDAHEAIINLHFKADAPPGEAGFTGLIGGLAEWVFIKPGIVSVTISAANRLLDQPTEALAAAVWQEVQHVTGIVSDMPQWRVIREKRATFAATPAQQMRRSFATTSLSNLVLAGDWTDTGLPATIEGAIRSGFAAAHHLRVP